MPTIDFYLINESDIGRAEHYICRLLEKAYKQHRQIYVQLATAADVMRLDELLWTYHDISFVPHAVAEKNNAAPIQLGYGAIPPQHHDILLNFSHQLPSNPQQFQRILEVVPDQPALRNQARQRYREYREQGCELKIV